MKKPSPALLPCTLLAAAVLLAGCAAVAPPAAPAPATPAAPAVADPRGDLVVERQWLQSWFRDTPVLIAQRRDGDITVEVPREFAFDHGRSSVKPPLAAVLDKVAESLHRRPLLQLVVLAAPGDVGGDASLAQQRARQVQRHLRSRGLAAGRLAAPTLAGAATVQLRIGPPPH